MIVSHSKRFIFFHIPRTAGSALRTALNSHQYIDFNTEDYIKKLPPGIDPMHINQTIARPMLENVDHYFEFTVVRNPLIRLLSLYNKFFNKFGTFSNFIQRLSAHYNNTFPISVHADIFNSQLHWIQTPLTSKIHIFKFEDIVKDTTELSVKLGIDPFFLPKENQAQQLVDSLSTTEIDFCKEFLKLEYEILNYN